MKKLFLLSCLICLALSVFAGDVLGNSRTSDPLGVAVSPQTLLLRKDQGGTVTVHTAISFTKVDSTSLQLSGVPVKSCHVDNLGNVVGEFDEAAVKAIVRVPQATLTLSGRMKTGETFSGSDTVRVIR